MGANWGISALQNGQLLCNTARAAVRVCAHSPGPFSLSLLCKPKRNVAIKYGRLFRGRSGARSRLAAGEMEPHSMHARAGREAPTTTVPQHALTEYGVMSCFVTARLVG